jgi:hypothetical protein
MGPRNAYKDMLDNVVSLIACVSMNHQNQLEQMANGAMFATWGPTTRVGDGVSADSSRPRTKERVAVLSRTEWARWDPLWPTGWVAEKQNSVGPATFSPNQWLG